MSNYWHLQSAFNKEYDSITIYAPYVTTVQAAAGSVL